MRNFEIREDNATIRHADAIVYLFDISEINEFNKVKETMEKVEDHTRPEISKFMIGYLEPGE